MTYIKLEDVQKILTSEIERLHGSCTLENILEKTNSLPSIDPQEMIREMIEETIKYGISTDEAQYFRILGRKLALQELLNKLPK